MNTGRVNCKGGRGDVGEGEREGEVGSGVEGGIRGRRGGVYWREWSRKEVWSVEGCGGEWGVTAWGMGKGGNCRGRGGSCTVL